MITIDDLARIDTYAAEAVADLRAAAEGYAAGGGVVGRGHRAQEHQAAAALAKRCAMLLQDEERDAAAIKNYRYVFNRGVFGVETGSTLELSYKQIMAMKEWLTGNPRRYEQVISGIIGAGESLEVEAAMPITLSDETRKHLDHAPQGLELLKLAEQERKAREMAEHTEAKCSINARMYDQNGVDVQVTLRDGVDGDIWMGLSTQWGKLSDHLVKKKGWTTSRAAQQRHAAYEAATAGAAVRPGPPRQEAQQQVAPPAGDPQKTGWCPKHQVRMDERSNEKGSWYSHKADGKWCRGE